MDHYSCPQINGRLGGLYNVQGNAWKGQGCVINLYTHKTNHYTLKLHNVIRKLWKLKSEKRRAHTRGNSVEEAQWRESREGNLVRTTSYEAGNVPLESRQTRRTSLRYPCVE